MALSPAEALQLTLEESDEVDRLEKQIDRFLRDAAPSSIGAFQICVPAMKQRIRIVLQQRYEAVGWRIRWTNSEREAGSIVLYLPQRDAYQLPAGA